MKYTIDINIQKSESIDNITLSLDTTNEGSVTITSYGTAMNLSQFIEFADAVQELREKFAIHSGKNNNNNGRTN
ncbi:MAG: hypothetical protein KBT34_08160 [Prevotella sp.]|nr:hypothetical protein [Candidatus Prevotella equi]